MNQWTTQINLLSKTIHHYKFTQTGTKDSENKPLRFDQVVELWGEESTEGESFRAFTTETITASPFVAFKWETPVVDSARFNREFEFVVLNSEGLDRRQNATAFNEHFQDVESDVLTLTFPNLGRNAVMVVPTPDGSKANSKIESPRADQVNHCHLASYLRTASKERTNDFWINVGQAMKLRVSNKPVWLSTAGGGVAWLHMRMDDRPKYYGYAPFKKA